ncbi:hypothetical protein CGLO_04116 [Colletotrichum gloeosporioides Cg-14]|uniref:Uncharacterized protein n=1 Tax=Colletotrichum gloeosporioides (strain Cg-14) TaxID=1237896 RepID=T0KUX0_COLGC|nr:hypothetical protein CGLO_04116 [Colletotrichum gloeosporioides Cg-14]
MSKGGCSRKGVWTAIPNGLCAAFDPVSAVIASHPAYFVQLCKQTACCQARGSHFKPLGGSAGMKAVSRTRGIP